MGPRRRRRHHPRRSRSLCRRCLGQVRPSSGLHLDQCLQGTLPSAAQFYGYEEALRLDRISVPGCESAVVRSFSLSISLTLSFVLFPQPLIQWAYILGHGAAVTSWGPTPVYTRLHALAASKSSYTILTSNADTLFAQSGGFDPSRIYTPQGSYAHFQCLRPCSPDSFFPSAPWIERALTVFDKATMRIPPDRAGELIPRCERCGGEVFYNVRGGNWFLETPQAGQRERYEAQVKEMVGRARERGKKVVVLELGVGFNTPSVVRWPSERLVEDDDEDGEVVRLIRVNQQTAEVPLELAGTGRAVGLKMGAMEFLQALDLP